VKNFSVKDDARADAGADCCEEHIAESSPGSPKVFGEAACVGVIVHFDVGGAVSGGFVGERKIAPARDVGWINDYAGAWIEGSGCENADALNFRAAGRILREERFDGGKNGGEPILRRCATIHRRACVRKNLSLRVHDASGYFCAADIHTNH